MAKFTAHSIEIHAINAAGGTIGPVTIGALTSTGHPLNTESTADDTGDIYDHARSIISQLPEPTYVTKSIQTILQILGLTGVCFTSDGSRPGVRIYGKVIADCKNNPGATDNLRYTIPRGLIVPTTLSVDRRSDATQGFSVHALTDGSNAPFSGDYSGITLPSSPVTEKYGMGAMRVRNVVWREPSNWSLNYNVSIDEKLPALASAWADTTGVRKVQPSLAVSGQDPTMLDDSTGIPLLGGQAVHTNTLLQLVKRVRGGAYVAAGNSEHFRMTLDGLTFIEDPFSTSGDAVAEMSAALQATYDGTNAPVVFGFNQPYSSTATV